MGGRRGWLVLGLVLAAGATAAVLVTDDARLLRVALLGMCWAFVITAFLAGDRRADQLAAAAREAELRHAYDLELEREVIARHQYEAQLEGRLRQEAERAMRGELTQLRVELAAVTELRTDLGRLRAELTEQLSGELLVERTVMRAQSVRGPGPSWDVDTWRDADVVPAGPVAAARPIPVPPMPARVPTPVRDETADAGRPPRHRRAAEPDRGPGHDELLVGAWHRDPSSGHGAAADEPAGHARLEQILAESGVQPRAARRHSRE